MRTQAFIDLFIGDTEAVLGHCDQSHAVVKFANTNLFFEGATRKEALAIANAINAAIKGAKKRSTVQEIDPSAIAAE